MKRQVSSNSIKKEQLKSMKIKVAKEIYDILINAYGPFGDKSVICQGYDFRTTKDGKEILNNIALDGQVEEFVINEFRTMAKYMEKNVGDATTTVALLATMILDKILNRDDIIQNPTRLIKEALEEISNDCGDVIRKRAREITPELAYNIAYVCSDGDKHLSELIKSVFEEHGSNITLEGVTVNRAKELNFINGVELDASPLSQSFMNNSNGTCELNNVNVLFYGNAIDSESMHRSLMSVIQATVMDPNGAQVDPAFKNIGDMLIILERGLNADADALLQPLFKEYSLLENAVKPKFCIVELRETGMDMKECIKNLTGALSVKKALHQDQPIDNTFSNIYHKMGFAKRVTVTGSKITFQDCMVHSSNNKKMSEWFFKTTAASLKLNYVNRFTDVSEVEKEEVEKDFKLCQEEYYKAKQKFEDEGSENRYKCNFDNVVAGMKATITEEEGRDYPDTAKLAVLRGVYKRLTTNLVQISLKVNNTSDIHGQQNMLDDVVTSINSAVTNGVGYASMTELFKFIKEYQSEDKSLKGEIVSLIYTSIKELLVTLYTTSGISIDEAKDICAKLEENIDKPYNIITKEFDDSLLTSIESDISIMVTVATILINLVTTNQLLVDIPGLDKIYV